MPRCSMPAILPIRSRQVLRRHAGAHHRRLAAPPVLYARAQPHRRCRARRRHGRSGARPLPAVDRGPAQGEALSARGPGRGTVPREVGHRLFGLEPQLRRDHRVLAFQDRRQAALDRAGAQPAAGRRRRQAQGGGRGARQDLQGQLAAVHADHQHARQGQGDFRPLARLQGRRRRAPFVQPRRARSGGGAGRRPCAPPIRSCRTATMR